MSVRETYISFASGQDKNTNLSISLTHDGGVDEVYTFALGNERVLKNLDELDALVKEFKDTITGIENFFELVEAALERLEEIQG